MQMKLQKMLEIPKNDLVINRSQETICIPQFAEAMTFYKSLH